MGKYQSYPEYKDSGVEWLDEVPIHWSRVPIKYMATERGTLFLDGDWIESKDLSTAGIRYITTGNVGEGRYKEQGAGYISEDKFRELNCTEVFEGDLLISRLNNPIGRACVVPDLDGRIVTSVDNVILRPNRAYHKNFLRHVFSSKEYFAHTGLLSRGATMQRISRRLLGNIRIPLPALDEQITIAAFLDHETAKIDHLIAKQERLIELLKEKRQAMISHAVTKGLDPDAPMKDSGVEWLGEVPANWKQVRLKRAIKLQRGHDLPDQKRLKGNVPVVTSGGVTAKHNEAVAKGPGIVTGRYGSIGVFYYIEDDYWPLNTTLYSVNTWGNSVRFLWYLLQNLGALFVSESLKSAVPGVDRNDVHEFEVVVPPTTEEQQKIVGHLDNLMASIDLLVGKTNNAIALMKEQRTALISAAVTGKIDVRNFKPANA